MDVSIWRSTASRIWKRRCRPASCSPAPCRARMCGTRSSSATAAMPWMTTILYACLPQGAVIGTCSVRRQAQLLHARPDLRITMMRGNVHSRLDKIRHGDCAASLLAMAGLRRARPGSGSLGRTCAHDHAARRLSGHRRHHRAGGRNRTAANCSRSSRTAQRAWRRRRNARCSAPWTAPAPHRSALLGSF